MEESSFGRYRLEQMLGRGGMGEVWRAYDTATNRVVAIKLLPAQLAVDSSFAQRFRREAEMAAQLNNPHVIPIHGYGEIDGRLYVDMRLVEGRDLQEVLRDGPLEPERAVAVVGQVAKALHAAHKIGLVHRDVKPSNILLAEDDFAYLIDFGIARGTDQTSITSPGSMIGTCHYMAPERIAGQQVDARSDVYALACVLYECLSGNRPFPGDSMESQLAAHLNTEPPTPSTTRPELERFDAVIGKGMAKNPDDRYATTVDLAHEARDAVTAPTSSHSRETQLSDPSEESTVLAPTVSSAELSDQGGSVAKSSATRRRPHSPAPRKPAASSRLGQPPRPTPMGTSEWLRTVPGLISAIGIVSFLVLLIIWIGSYLNT